MNIGIEDLNDQTFINLFSPCNDCVYWEAPELLGQDEHGNPKLAEEKAIKIKQDWYKKTSVLFGCCGMILHAKGEAAGYAQYAPPHLLPNVVEYSQTMSSPSPDAVLVSCLYIKKEYQRQGLGRRLLRAVVESLKERGYGAVETYARDDSADNCSGPKEFYLRNGFGVIETQKWDQATFSLMRLELLKE